MIDQGLSFSDAKNTGKNQTGPPPMGARNRGGVGSNGDFRYISEMVQNMDIVTMER